MTLLQAATPNGPKTDWYQ